MRPKKSKKLLDTLISSVETQTNPNKLEWNKFETLFSNGIANSTSICVNRFLCDLFTCYIVYYQSFSEDFKVPQSEHIPDFAEYLVFASMCFTL